MRLEWLSRGRANLQWSVGAMLLFILRLKRLILLHPARPDLSTGQQDQKLDDVSTIGGLRAGRTWTSRCRALNVVAPEKHECVMREHKSSSRGLPPKV